MSVVETALKFMANNKVTGDDHITAKQLIAYLGYLQRCNKIWKEGKKGINIKIEQ